MKPATYLLFILTIFMGLPVQAAPNCNLPKNETEILICNTPELMTLAQSLDEKYTLIKKNVDFSIDYSIWKASIHNCRDKDCISIKYQDMLDRMDNLLRPASTPKTQAEREHMTLLGNSMLILSHVLNYH